MVATVPVWPPPSVPWATTKSTPLATALTAWRTLPHMLPTSTLRECSRSMTSRGTPRPATKMRAPPSATACTPASTWPGSAVSRSTPNGLAVAAFTAAISAFSSSVPMVLAPSVPMPPASLTAATSAE